MSKTDLYAIVQAPCVEVLEIVEQRAVALALRRGLFAEKGGVYWYQIQYRGTKNSEYQNYICGAVPAFCRQRRGSGSEKCL